MAVRSRVAVIHWHELALKGENKPFFEEALRGTIARVLSFAQPRSVVVFAGRIVVSLEEGTDEAAVTRALKNIFGIANFAIAVSLPREKEAAFREIVADAKERAFKTFRVSARRADKNFPLTSQEINVELGALIAQATGARVNLKQPEATFFVEVVRDKVFFYTKKEKGLGGLPVGVSGKVLALISSGFDSPVAAWKMMRRGCEVMYVHFHSYPSTSAASRENVGEIVKVLTRYQHRAMLLMVPLLPIQQAIARSAIDPRERVVLYRRFMMRIAERLAVAHGCDALVTGDSLGQVASQTLENIGVVSRAVSMPIFRPLIGENKEDIISAARAIGTHDISAQPYEDCCSLFVPEHPETRANLAVIEESENKVAVEKLINDALSGTESIKVKL